MSTDRDQANIKLVFQDKRSLCHGSIKSEEILNGDMICLETLTYFTEKSLDHNSPITNWSFTFSKFHICPMFKITYDHYTIMTIFHENLSKHINM